MRRRQVDQFTRFLHGRRNRLFNQDMLAKGQRGGRSGEMMHGRARHGHDINLSQQVFKRVERPGAMLFGQRARLVQVRIKNAYQLGPVMGCIFGRMEASEHPGPDNPCLQTTAFHDLTHSD